MFRMFPTTFSLSDLVTQQWALSPQCLYSFGLIPFIYATVIYEMHPMLRVSLESGTSLNLGPFFHEACIHLTLASATVVLRKIVSPLRTGIFRTRKHGI